MDELSQPVADDGPFEPLPEYVEPTPNELTPIEPRGKLTHEFAQPAESLPRGVLVYKLAWLMTVMALLLASTWIVPYFVEEFHYAKERGRQRAQVEMAPVALKGLGLEQLSRAYQLVSQRVGPSVVHINVVEDEAANVLTAGDSNEHQAYTD